MGGVCTKDDEEDWEQMSRMGADTDEHNFNDTDIEPYEGGYQSGDASPSYVSTANQEIAAMSQEVILLSTRNANLEQELGETKKQNESLQKEIETVHLEQRNKNFFTAVCDKFDIDDIDDSYYLNKDLVEMLDLTESLNENESEYLKSVTFTDDMLALLGFLLKERKENSTVNRIVSIHLFKKYYNESNGEDETLQMILNICKQFNETTENINKIQELIKQETMAKSSYNQIVLN